MEENLGTLYFDFRARQAAWKQDLAQMDRDIDAYRKKWEAPMRVGGGGGGSGGGGGNLSPATAAAVASVGGGGGGPNFTGTSNGDVTWNLRQAVRDTGAKYGGGGGRSRGGGIGMEDGAPDARIGDVAGEFVQQSRIRGELGFSRESSRRAGVLSAQQSLYDQLHGQSTIRSELGAAREASDRQLREQRNQDAVDESKYQSENSFMGKLKKPITIRSLLRGTMAGMVIDAMAGELGNEANYQKAMQLAGMDSVAQSSATIGRVRGGLSAIPFVGGVLNSLASVAISPIETQNEMTDRQASYQNDRFGSLMGRRASIYQRQEVAAGPNSLTAQFANLQAQRVGITEQVMGEAQKRRDDFTRTNLPAAPSMLRAFGNAWVDGGIATRINPLDLLVSTHDDYQRQQRDYSVDSRNYDASQRSQSQTANSIRDARLGVNDQQKLEAARTGWFNLSMTTAELNRQKMANQFRPSAADAQFAVEQGQAILDEYGNRPNTTATDQRQTKATMELLGEGLRGKQRDILEDIRWGTLEQYNPMIESPLSFADRNTEPIGDKLDALTTAITENTAQIQALMNKPN